MLFSESKWKNSKIFILAKNTPHPILLLPIPPRQNKNPGGSLDDIY